MERDLKLGNVTVRCEASGRLSASKAATRTKATKDFMIRPRNDELTAGFRDQLKSSPMFLHTTLAS
jgi:hypothetical protein